MELFDLDSIVDQSFDGVCYRRVAPRGEDLPPPPRFLFGPIPRLFGEWYFSDRWTPEAGLYSLPDVALQDDRILLWRDKTLCIPQNGIHRDSIAALIGGQPVKARQTLRIDEEVVLLSGPGYSMYGHWLVDFMPRLHVLTALGYDLATLRYLLPHDTRPFVLDWLRHLGIGDAQLIPYQTATQKCEIARALIPTNLRGNGRASPLLAEAVADFRHRIGVTVSGVPHRRIFVSRRNWNNPTRQLTNIDQVEALFRRRGFEIVFPETMNIAWQVRLFSESRIIAGEYGSGLHGGIFAPANATIIALRGTEHHPGFLQSGLSHASGHHCGYVFGNTHEADGRQTYEIDERDLAICLDNVIS
jgi:capsular polysaccharide biosynthesis protein